MSDTGPPLTRPEDIVLSSMEQLDTKLNCWSEGRLYLESASQVDMRTTVKANIVSREKGFYRPSIAIRSCPCRLQTGID